MTAQGLKEWLDLESQRIFCKDPVPIRALIDNDLGLNIRYFVQVTCCHGMISNHNTIETMSKT